MPSEPGPGGQDVLQQLTVSQRAVLRIVCWVAWSDGDFAQQERELLETVVSRLLLGGSAAQAVDAVRTLASEHLQNTDVEAVVAELEDADERQLVVKLALQMVSISHDPGDTAPINPAEKQAYRRLVEALDLSESDIQESEWAARQELEQKPSLMDLLTGALERFGAWPSPQELDPRLPLGYWL